MKKACIALVAVLLVFALVPVVRAAVEVSGDAYVGYYDKYLWRGFDLSGGKPVVQGGVDLSAYGVTLSYWTNYQTRDAEGAGLQGGEINETDIALDYSVDLNDIVSLSVGNIFYILDGLRDSNELYLSASLNTLLSPSATIFWDYDEAKADGYFVSASIGHTFELVEKLGLNVGAAVSYNGASDYSVGNYHDFHNFELSARLDYGLLDQLTISPLFIFSSPISDEAKEAIDTEVHAGLNVAQNF